MYLRELSGRDELWDDSPAGLIDRLLIDRPGVAARPGEAQALTIAEADRVLAAIYRSLYGDGVECQVSCPACGVPYALSFTLADLWASVTETTVEDEALLGTLDGPDENGVYRSGWLAFRLPTGSDLAEVGGLEREQILAGLRARCVVGRADQIETVERLMSLVGPVLDADLDSCCPECGGAQPVQFRLDEFLLAALRRERALLIREVHELARAYRWARRDILEMPRHERRQYAGLVLAESTSPGTWP